MSEKEPVYFWAILSSEVDHEMGRADSEADALESLKENIEEFEVGYVLQSVAEVRVVKRTEVVVTA